MRCRKITTAFRLRLSVAKGLPSLARKKDKAELQNALTAAREELVNKDRSDQEEIDYLRRTIARPRTHAEITNWVNNTFSIVFCCIREQLICCLKRQQEKSTSLLFVMR